MSPEQQADRDQRQRVLNLTLASVAGQVGFLTLAIIVVALIAGLWLDARFDSKPLFTLILLLGSVPVTLVVMYRVATAAVRRMKTVAPPASRGEEEKKVGQD